MEFITDNWLVGVVIAAVFVLMVQRKRHIGSFDPQTEAIKKFLAQTRPPSAKELSTLSPKKRFDLWVEKALAFVIAVLAAAVIGLILSTILRTVKSFPWR